MEGRSEPAWRSGFQQKYLSRLITELRRRRFERGSSSVWGGVRAVKSAADVSLAMVARGRTAWSRATIFARAGNRSLHRVSRRRRNHVSKSNFHLHLRSLMRSAYRPWNAFSSKMNSVRRLRRSSPRSRGDEEESVQSRIKTLRTLVPGSRRLDTPLLLEEVADYIMALKMQVQSMQALTSHLANWADGAGSCPR
ncbi:hypothetical protein SUGI_0635190 [Cryptomeria japonica]|uniref:transcription factor bHLH147 n=1 Tax=Cryptomeria japonica TaxID=3369 RepID=UPI002414AC1D|nr:transcription factor bHLH147 [Cryptomeria japonica]GLJ31628.1 hypothetical protein SUGI_0635190 [Cryptomeria japonica]